MGVFLVYEHLYQKLIESSAHQGFNLLYPVNNEAQLQRWA